MFTKNLLFGHKKRCFSHSKTPFLLLMEHAVIGLQRFEGR